MNEGKGIEDAIPSRPVTPSDSDCETLHFDAHPQDPEVFSHNGDKVIVANSGGETLLAKLTATEKNTEILLSKDRKMTHQIETLQKKVDENQMEIRSLKTHLRQLMESSDDYFTIRRRFLEVYQRDVKGGELGDYETIQRGNVVAHEGDALGDAMVFARDGRQDRKLYRELYGLEYTQVLEFYTGANDGGLYLVLNAHATLLAKGNTPSDELKSAFDSFIDNIEKYWPQLPNSDPDSPLGRAYYTFWKNLSERT